MHFVKKATFFLLGSAVALVGAFGIALLFNNETLGNGKRTINTNGNDASVVIQERAVRCRDPKTGRFAKCP